MLTTDALNDADLDRAAGELMANAERLALAGFAPQAHDALMRLLQPGPWRLPAHGRLVQRLERTLPAVSLLAQRQCPAVGDGPAIDVADLEPWAETQSDALLRGLAQPVRVQHGPAGAGWSDEFLSTLAQRRGAPTAARPHAEFGRFCIDAEFVLKARVQQRFGVSGVAHDLPSAEDLRALGLPDEELALLLGQIDQVESATRIDVAPAADAIETLAIGRAVIAYLRETGFGGGHLDPVFAACWLLLAEAGDDAAAAEIATGWLRQDQHAAARLLDFASVPSVRRFLLGSALAPALQIDAPAARAWLAGLSSRQAAASGSSAPSSRASAPEAPLDGDPAALLQGTPLQSLPWLVVPVPDSDERAWVANVPVAERRASWQAARDLVARTGRWPIVTTLWSGPAGAGDEGRLSDELFMRSPYAQGASRDDLSPRSFIADSQAIAPAAFLAALAEGGPAMEDEPQADTELDPELGRQPAFDPDNAWLVLLPSPLGENALAYLHWYGLERGSTEGFIRLLRDWRERHGAELWAHYGTMLEFTVERPPADLDAALPLAREHALAAPCTLDLSGIPQRHYALGLVGHREWFLHERP